MQTTDKILQREQQKISTTPTTLPRFDEVQLTEEEKSAILHDARLDKYWRQRKIWDLEEKEKLINEAKRPWTAAEMYQHALKVAGENKPYIIDQFNEPVFKQLSLYFSGDKRFESNPKMSLQKGIMLIGGVGVGKTELLKAFRFNKRQCFIVESCKEVEQRCRQNGYEYWKTYIGFVPGYGGTSKYFFQPQVGWMLDDLGTEEIIKDYGNTLDVIESLIQQRYFLGDMIPFSSLHITTNMDGDMIEQRYGQRVRSRLREMFNIIELKGTDRRK